MKQLTFMQYLIPSIFTSMLLLNSCLILALFKTIVSDRDANKLGVDYKMLEKLDCGMLGIGGTVDTYVLKDAKLIFNSADNKAHIERLDSLCFLKHSEMNERIVRIPSVLEIIYKELVRHKKGLFNHFAVDLSACRIVF